MKNRLVTASELLDFLKINNSDLKILIRYFKFPRCTGIQCKKKKEKIWNIKSIALWLEDEENLKELKCIQEVRKNRSAT